MKSTLVIIFLISSLGLSACLPKEDDIPLNPAPTTTSTPNPVQSPEVPPTTIISPAADTVVASPLIVEGNAPIDWFLEDMVIAKIITSDGRVIALASMPRQNQETQTNQVSFKGSMEFDIPEDATEGFVVVQKSDEIILEEPQASDSVSVPIRFK